MIDLEVSPGAQADAAAEEQLVDGHLTVPGGLEWDETPVERHTIANLRYAGGKEHDVRYVSEVHLDAALAREAEVGRLYDSLVNRSNRERDASYKREDALREELANHDSAAMLMNAWVAEKGQMSWVTAINIMAIATKMPDEERQRLIDMDDGSTERGALIAERDALQQRLTAAERREAEAREELLELSRKLDVFYSRSHGIKNLSEIEKANDKAKALKLKVGEYEVLLNMSKELLTTISRHGATTKPVDWCDSFKAEVADRIEKIDAALKPAAEGEGS